MAYAIGVSKPLSIYIRLANGDEGKVGVKKEEENFNLSPRGIREMLQLNKPIYEITSAYGHFEESQQIKVNLAGKKQIKLIYLNCNLENLNFLQKIYKNRLSKWALAHFFRRYNVK